MIHQLLRGAEGALEILFPKECLVCRRSVRATSLCSRCEPPRPQLGGILSGRCVRCFGPFIGEDPSFHCDACITYPPYADRIRYIWEYGGLARDFIRAMKYRPSVKLARLSGRWLADSLPALFPDGEWDLITPIPSSPTAFRRRLFQPCVELSLVVRHAVPHCRVATLLKHADPRLPQALRTHDERLRGLKTMFNQPKAHLVLGKRVLVIEDVITTGATVAAAVNVLRKAGAVQVDVLALAQTPVWYRFRARLNKILPPQLASL